MEDNFEATQSQDGTSGQEQEQNLGQETQQAEIPDIGSFEKFKFEGKEWTPKELKSAYMMQSDYTRKTQEVAQERKYSENLVADLRAVKENPDLMNEFMKVYPKKYHSYLDVVRGERTQQTQGQKQEVNPYDQRISQLESTLTAWQQDQFEKQVSSIEAEIDSHLSKAHNAHKDVLTNPKMKDMFDQTVIQRASMLRDSGQIDKFDAKTWERITNSVAEDFKMFQNINKSTQVNNQRAANAKGKDTPSGGGIPSQAPVKAKNFREATANAVRHYENIRR